MGIKGHLWGALRFARGRARGHGGVGIKGHLWVALRFARPQGHGGTRGDSDGDTAICTRTRPCADTTVCTATRTHMGTHTHTHTHSRGDIWARICTACTRACTGTRAWGGATMGTRRFARPRGHGGAHTHTGTPPFARGPLHLHGDPSFCTRTPARPQGHGDTRGPTCDTRGGLCNLPPPLPPPAAPHCALHARCTPVARPFAPPSLAL